MADSTSSNRDYAANRRADVASWFHSIGQMIDQAVPFEQVETYVDTALETAVAKYYQLRSDEHDLALRDYESDLSAHTCIGGAWCYVCAVQKAQEGGRT